ncbi:MAG TPA: hypothetical protein IAB17_05665, partial [Candidatus Alectryocaccobium stercorigallinarum]|nr:hypothetical protein [Candidatus Alectryocaccobium stercorigallinarum]
MKKSGSFFKKLSVLALAAALTAGMVPSVFAEEAAETGAVETDDVQQPEEDVSAGSDFNKPVIEKIELVQQGQTLSAGDTVEVRIYAYDADSGIRDIDVEFVDSTDMNNVFNIYPEYDEASGCYIGRHVLENLGNGSVSINNVYVVDNNSNYLNGNVTDENGYLYTFNIENDIAS